ncbi:hypothetical protein GCM10008986_02220 [Salinibacillus aidingensis]|uniref:Heptaprenyl diphosphate synthase n=1 Tax=Salinibacillus aidingensis TaxID=237684 RepID=A0ABN1APB2_9BACI
MIDLDPKFIQKIKDHIIQFADEKFGDIKREPVLSEDKILFLDTILDYSDNLARKEKEQIIQAIMYVQTALDIHDFVSIHSYKHDQINQQKQMNVLVGDLLSGKFYHNLSRVEYIDLIEVIAGAIRTINERKMMIYHSDIHSIEHLIEEMKEVESAIVIHVAEYFKMTEHHDVIKNWLLMKRLFLELKTYAQEQKSAVITLLSQSNNEDDVIRMVENMIPGIMIRLESLIQSLPLHLNELRMFLMNELKRISQKQGILLEEG